MDLFFRVYSMHSYLFAFLDCFVYSKRSSFNWKDAISRSISRVFQMGLRSEKS